MTIERAERVGAPQHRSIRVGYEPFDWMFIRTPLLPMNVHPRLSSDAVVRSLAERPSVQAALATASPGLLARLHAADPANPSDDRLTAVLRRYLIRMSTRPTPFGLFSGVALGSWAISTDVRFGASPARTRTRPDMAWLLAFVGQIEARPEIRRHLRHMTNGGVWIDGGRARLAQRTPMDGSGSVAPVDVRATPTVRRALELARDPIQFERLASALGLAPSATRERVEQLLTELWQGTFLLTELRPAVAGRDPVAAVLAILADIPSAADEFTRLSKIVELMTGMDDLGRDDLVAAQARAQALATTAVPRFDGVAAQVDTALALSDSRVAASIGRAAAQAGELLVRLAPRPPDVVGAYHRAFVDRYGAEREVSVLELFDPERGLGPTPPDRPTPSEATSNRAYARGALLRSLATDALRERQIAVELDHEAIDLLTTAEDGDRSAPVSLDVSVYVLATSTADIDAGDFRLLVGPHLGAQAAGRNLGRFTDLLGRPAADALAQVAAAEVGHDPRSLHVEASFLPGNPRSANVVLRRSPYTHEVVVTSMPSFGPAQTIPLSEVVVGVRGGALYARWERDGRDLHVHVGHMLSPLAAPPALRFLEDLSRQRRSLLTPFDWGASADLPFLPRIEHQRIVLAPAQWRIDSHVAGSYGLHSGNIEAMSRWRADWMVPRRVYLTVGDNRLLLDLEEPVHVDLLRTDLRMLAADRSLRLQEPLPDLEHAWVEGPEGCHVAELIVPLIRVDAGARGSPPVAQRSTAEPVRPVDRLRPPGSDWLYAKVYARAGDLDELIVGAGRDLAESATGSGVVDRWFFLRYADPEPHLRLRFGGSPHSLLTDLLPMLCAWASELITDGAVTRLVLDTYEREIERFGGPAGMAVAEEIFAVDSRTVADLLDVRLGGGALDPTTLAVLSMEDLLQALGLDVAERRALYRGGAAERRATGPDHRRRGRQLRALAAGSEASPPEIRRTLRERRRLLRPLGVSLRQLAERSELSVPIARINATLAHLHCNRLLGAGGPTEGHVLGLLERVHESLDRYPVDSTGPLGER